MIEPTSTAKPGSAPRNELPVRLAAFAGLVGFAIAVLNGMIAGNESMVILLRAVLAMIACWLLAWIAGTFIVLAVRRDEVPMASVGPELAVETGEPAADADLVDSPVS